MLVGDEFLKEKDLAGLTDVCPSSDVRTFHAAIVLSLEMVMKTEEQGVQQTPQIILACAFLHPAV